MPRIRIPKSAYAAIQHLIHFSEPDFDAFLDALSKAEPSLDQDNFWKHVAKHVNRVDQSVIESILHEIFQMDDARVDAAMDGLGLNEFAESVAEAAASSKSEVFPFEEGDGKILKDRLVRVFKGSKGLKITMKAMGVMVDQDHIFSHARILTVIHFFLFRGTRSRVPRRPIIAITVSRLLLTMKIFGGGRIGMELDTGQMELREKLRERLLFRHTKPSATICVKTEKSKRDTKKLPDKKKTEFQHMPLNS